MSQLLLPKINQHLFFLSGFIYINLSVWFIFYKYTLCTKASLHAFPSVKAHYSAWTPWSTSSHTDEEKVVGVLPHNTPYMVLIIYRPSCIFLSFFSLPFSLLCSFFFLFPILTLTSYILHQRYIIFSPLCAVVQYEHILKKAASLIAFTAYNLCCLDSPCCHVTTVPCLDYVISHVWYQTATLILLWGLEHGASKKAIERDRNGEESMESLDLLLHQHLDG